MKNYAYRGGAAEADIILQDLHNSLYPTKAEFINFLIIQFLVKKKQAKTCLPSSVLSSP